jgi:hypothetical protein
VNFAKNTVVDRDPVMDLVRSIFSGHIIGTGGYLRKLFSPVTKKIFRELIFCMITLPQRLAYLLAAWSTVIILPGLSVAAPTNNEIVFKSLADFDKCIVKNYDADFCLEAVQNYAKTHPSELFAIGKRVRLQLKHWTALQFFEPALGASPTANQCADPDISLAIISGLALPTENEPNAIARRMLNGKCFASLRPTVEKEIASAQGTGYLPQHACPIFVTKGIKVDACTPKKEVAVAPKVVEKLPVVNMAKVKVGIIKVYSGSEGERIMMADVKGLPGTYLIRIDGVRSPINGKTMVHKEEQSGDRSEYWTEIDGKRWNTIKMRDGNYKKYEVYIPGFRNAIEMRYSKGKSKTASIASFKK